MICMLMEIQESAGQKSGGRMKKGGNNMYRQWMMGVLLISVLLCASGTAAYAMPETSVENNFETGIVDISLREYMLNENGEETEWVDPEAVLPGMQISKIPRITNEGNSCYVRVKLEFEGTETVDEEDIYGMDVNWSRAEDGYYYYKNILGESDSVDVFQGIRIPEDLSQEEMQGQKFTLNIDADAIQAANFTPDFEAAEPWGKVEILESTAEEGYDITAFKRGSNLSLEIEYQGSAGTMTADPDDFFSNIPYLMPGDEYSDSAVMKNESDHDMRIYFRSELLEEKEILDRIELLIEADTLEGRRTIYDGELCGKDITDSICLGTIPAGGQGEFSFAIRVPAELDNEYSLEAGCVKWIFSAEEIIREQIAVQTGDNNEKLGMALLGCGCSLGSLAALLLYRQRKRHTGFGKGEP